MAFGAVTVARMQAVLDADTRGFDSKMRSSQTKTEKFGKVASTALIGGVAAGITALGVAAKIGFDEFSAGQKELAQTRAVIKSTGGVAGITAKHVEELAQSHLKLTGIDDELIVNSENILLTFRNIRNEMGKGNDIFDRAQMLTEDLSVAMGVDMHSAAIQVGKALNDPIRGYTRLQRIGVTFTDAQIKQIEAMDAAGDRMGAQKVILKELQTEFGGSAKAAGETFAGSINKLHERFNNFMGDVVEKGIPYVQQFIKWIGPYAQDALDKTREVVAHIRSAFDRFNEILDEHRDTVNKVTKVLGILATAVTFLWKWEIKLYLKLVDVWLKILSVTLTVTDKIIGAFEDVIDKIRGTIDWFEKLYDKAKGPVGDIGKFIGDKLVDPLKNAVKWIEDLIGFAKDLVGWIGKIDFPSVPSWVPIIGGDGIVGAGGSGPKSISSGLWDDLALGQSAGLMLTSGYRPGAITSTGNPSLHGVYPSKAIDMAGSESAMRAFFLQEATRGSFRGSGLAEVIHSPYWWHPGAGITKIPSSAGSVLSDHYNHVHVGSYDRGGYLRPGWNLAYNGLGRPEPVGAGTTYNINGAILDGEKLLRYIREQEAKHQRRGGMS